MDRTLTIIEQEEKISKDGKPYKRYKDYDGVWYTCFNSDAKKILEKAIKEQLPVVCDVDGNLIRWTELYSVPEEQIVISNAPKKKTFDSTTMYVSYAKDIFVSLIERKVPINRSDSEVMQDCIDLVKQAKEDFEK